MATLTDWIKQSQAGTANNPAPNYTRKSPMELLIMQQSMEQNADSKTVPLYARQLLILCFQEYLLYTEDICNRFDHPSLSEYCYVCFY